MTAEILHIRDWQSPEERETKPVSATLHLIDQITGIEISRHAIGVDGRIPAELCANTVDHALSEPVAFNASLAECGESSLQTLARAGAAEIAKRQMTNDIRSFWERKFDKPGGSFRGQHDGIFIFEVEDQYHTYSGEPDDGDAA